MCTAISVTSNGSWDLSVEDDSWLKVMPTSGTGNKTLSIQAFSNMGSSKRTNQIRVKSKGGNMANIEISQNSSSEVGIDEHKKLLVDVYPNPTNGYIHLRCRSSAVLTMYNNTGAELMSIELTDNETALDVRDITPGIYLIKIANDQGTFLKKVIKQ